MADKAIPNSSTNAESEMNLSVCEVNTPLSKGKKLKIKVKKKNALNISKGKLKSGCRTPNNFSFLNMSVQKQTLRANNRALAENLAKVRQELHQSNSANQKLILENQQNGIELNRLRILVGLKDDKIEIELQSRMEQHKQEMLALLQDLTSSMMQSTKYITSMQDKCQIQSRLSIDSATSRSATIAAADIQPSTNSISSRSASVEAADVRPSTDSTTSRSASVAAADVRSSTDSATSRSASMTAAVKKKSSRNHIMTPVFPKDDEFAAPRPTDETTKWVSTDLDMSAIAEQSMLDDNTDLYTPLALPSVQETIVESSPTANVASKPLSKLPLRVLRHSIGLSTSASVTCNEDTKIKKYNKTAPMPQVGQAKDEQKSIEVEKIKCQSEKCKKEVQDEEQLKIDEDINLEHSDSYHLKDVSAFGFGGNFGAELVSGSPLINPDSTSHSKHLESLISHKTSNCAIDSIKDIKDKTAKKQKKVVLNSTQQVNEKKQENGHKKLNTASNIIQKLPIQGNNLSKSKSDSCLLRRNSKSPINKTCKVVKDKSLSRQKSDLHISNVQSKSKEITKEADNSKSLATLRSPDNILQQGEVYNDIKDPFKPTNSLVRSPFTKTGADADAKQDNWKENPVANINSLAFLNKIRGSIDSKAIASEPLPQPSFVDETTTYFNTEMDFTAVIDSSKFAAHLDNCDNRSPKIVNIEGNKTNKGTLQNSDISHMKGINSKNENDKVREVAALEVKTVKPGVFTFNVGRKDAGGIRKPIPENISKTRSKKKVLTPEKAEMKMGDDRDTFNFGDRTPTVPLEKLAKANTSDLNESGHLSVNVLKNDQKMIKDASDVEKVKHKNDENIYFVPMSKGSPQDQPNVRRARSKSGNRSKTHKRDDDDDDNWLPGGKTKSKSQSCSRSRSKTAKSSNTEIEVKSNDRHCLKTELTEHRNIVTADGKDVAEAGMPRKSVRARTKTKTLSDDLVNIRSEINTYEDKGSIDVNKYHVKDHGNSVHIGNKSSELEIMDLTSNECIYNVPMAKGSPEHKHVTTRARSKSGTRSKSRTVDIESDMSPDGSTQSEVCFRARSRSRQTRDFVNVPDSVTLFGASRTAVDSDNEKRNSSEFVKELKGERNNRSRSLQRKDNRSMDIVEMVEAVDSDIENNQHFKSINKLKINGKSENPLISGSAGNGVHCFNGEHEKLFKVPLKPKDKVNKKRGRPLKHLIISDVASDVSLNDLKDKSDKLDDRASICSKHLPEIKPATDSTDQNVSRKSLLTKKCTTSVKEKKADVAVTKDKTNRDKERLSIYQKAHIPDLDKTLPSEVAPSQSASVSKVCNYTMTANSSRKRVADNQPNPGCTPKVQVKQGTDGQQDSKCKLRMKLETSEDLGDQDGFAMLKKRLAMLDSGSHDSEMLRKRRLTSSPEENTSDSEGGTDGKRFRRSRIGISYALKPLNAKLRRGDKMFDSPTTKAKTEQARLTIAKKTAVSRHIKDHDENVEPAVQA